MVPYLNSLVLLQQRLIDRRLSWNVQNCEGFSDADHARTGELSGT